MTSGVVAVARVPVDPPAGRPARSAAGRDALRALAAGIVGADPADVTVRARCATCGGPHGRPVLGGSRDLVDRIVARRLLGPGWTSRMVQAILHDLLTDDASVRTVLDARDAYAVRQLGFSAAMGNQGVRLSAGDGLNAWLPVADERAAMVSLAAAGIRVAPGAPFQLGAGSPHVRITVGLVHSDADEIASAIAAASRA